MIHKWYICTHTHTENTSQYLLGLITGMCSLYPVKTSYSDFLSSRLGLKVINISFPMLKWVVGKIYWFSSLICFIFCFSFYFIKVVHVTKRPAAKYSGSLPHTLQPSEFLSPDSLFGLFGLFPYTLCDLHISVFLNTYTHCYLLLCKC